MTIPAAERRALASQIGCNEQYLYQCLTGRGSMSPEDATRAEFATGRRLRRWHLRRKDWHHVWPELLDAPDAPEPPSPPLQLGTPPAR